MESLQKIDLHLHLSRIPLPRTEQMWVSDPACPTWRNLASKKLSL